MKHRPSMTWLMRRHGTYPNGEVRTSEYGIVIAYSHGAGHGVDRIEMTRRDARLLAKRINECLDATK